VIANALLEQTLDLCVQSGIDALKRAKFTWWPTEGQSDFSEDNLWFYVGWALQNAGFHVYAKAQVAGSARQHVDAVAIHQEYQCAVIIEAKRLHSSEKHRLLGDDWLRIQRMKLPCEWLPFPQPLRCYALLIGSCWSREHYEWWIDPSRTPAPARCPQTDSWLNTRAALESATRIGAIDLDVQHAGWLPHWICYSLNKLPDNLWCAMADAPGVITAAGG